MTQVEQSTETLEQVAAPLAYRIKDVPSVLPISLSSVYNEIKRGKLFATRLHMVPREEILRYLRDEVKLAKRRATRGLSTND